MRPKLHQPIRVARTQHQAQLLKRQMAQPQPQALQPVKDHTQDVHPLALPIALRGVILPRVPQLAHGVVREVPVPVRCVGRWRRLWVLVEHAEDALVRPEVREVREAVGRDGFEE